MSEIILFGETTYRNEMRRFGIKTDDRRRHMYLIGKTGMGKSTILENMMINDINAGRGLAITDPHGDLAEKIIKFIPDNRINDVIYFNPGDIDYPIAFNVIEQVDPHFRHLVASGLLGVFKKLWADSWGPRLEYTLRNSILAVLDYPDATLLAVVRMLSDKVFRKEVVSHIKDPVVKSFWVKEFASYTDKFASEAVAPIQNKVGQFLSASLIRNIVGQTSSSLNIRQIMDEKKILIMNLSKGLIGEDNMQLLGAMMITKIQLAAMSRVDIPEETRNDFYLYVDEFQNFATESFANILSEARKYRLNLVMAHQYIEQLDEKVRDAVFGNVGSFVVCRVGAADAEVLAPEFTPTFEEEDIVNIPKYEFYCKLMIDGIASDPFSAKGIAPMSSSEQTGNVDKIITSSRERFSQNRHIVEEKIAKWHESDENHPNEGAKDAARLVYKGNQMEQGNRSRPTNFQNRSPESSSSSGKAYPCTKCSRSTFINFTPDGVRPIYCKDCLTDIKDGKKANEEERMSRKQEELRRARANQPMNNNATQPFKLNISRGSSENNDRIALESRTNPTNANSAHADSNINVPLRSALLKSPVKFRGNKQQSNNANEGELTGSGEININQKSDEKR